MKKTISLALFVCANFLSVFAQNGGKSLNLSNKIAVQGYDPVAYFTVGKAAKGKSAMTATHEGATYYFSTADNQKAFLAMPQKYTPQYGGWCAYAMGATGDKVEINPKTFKITDGKLYLFYNAYFNNTLKSWNKDAAKLRSQADKNWSAIR